MSAQAAHQARVRQQDLVLTEMQTSLQNLAQSADAIGTELTFQEEIMSDVDLEMGRADAGTQVATSRMSRLAAMRGKCCGGCGWKGWCIVGLGALLLVLVVLVVLV